MHAVPVRFSPEILQRSLVAAIIATSVLLVDLATPLGYAEWVFYVMVLAVVPPRRLHLFAAASFCTVLIAIGYFASPGVPHVFSGVNRLAGVIVLFGIAVLLDSRKRAEDRAFASLGERDQADTRLRNLFHQANDAIFLLAADSRFLDTNDAGCRLTGYSRDELLGMCVSDVLAPVEWPRLQVERPEDMMAGNPHLGEWWHRRKDGSLWLGEVNAKRLDGQSYLAIVRDITARRETEDRLAASEARLRLAVRAANVGLFDWNLETNAVFFSPEWKAQIGYEDHEIPHVFEEWRKRVHPDDIEATLAQVNAYIADPRGKHEAEFRLRHKDGSWRWIHAQGDVVRDAEGRSVRMLGCHVDITDRKHASERLEASERLLRDIINGLGPYMFVGLLDTEGNVLMANLPALEGTGLASDDVLGKRLEELSVISHSPEVQQRLRTAIDHAACGESSRFDITLQVAGGGPMEVDFTVQPLRDAAGNIRYLVPSAVVITERKQAEASLRESNAELRRLNQRLELIREQEQSRIAREIHDVLGQLLTSVRLDLFHLRGLLGAAKPQVAEQLATLEQLTGDTLWEMRRISSELHPAILTDLGLLAAVEWHCRQFEKRSATRLVMDLPPDEPALSLAAKTVLFRILQESLTNVARHAGASKVEVGLHTSVVAGRRMLELKVADNGSGINLAYSRTGHLGLVSMRERAAAAQGEVSVETSSAGTTITARVPLEEASCKSA